MLRKCIAAVTVLLLAISLTACGKQTEYYEKTGFAMGSVVSVRIYGSENAEQTAQNVLNSVNETDSLLSANREDADIYKLNASPHGLAVSEETFKLLGDCLSVSNTTGRVLDITIGAVSELWGFDTESPSLPDAAAIEKALQTVDMNELLLDEENLTVGKKEGQKIDLGAFGKGIAAMRALDELRGELAPAVISVGGTILLYGNHPDKDSWVVGVRDPHGSPDEYCASLALTVRESDDTLVVSTSGNYEKTFTQDNRVWHHILDKTTGMPVENDLLGVTVVATGGLVSDALSTVLFIHGLSEQSLQIIENYRVGAVFLCKDGRMLVSDSLADKITVTNDAWTLGDLEEAIKG